MVASAGTTVEAQRGSVPMDLERHEKLMAMTHANSQPHFHLSTSYGGVLAQQMLGKDLKNGRQAADGPQNEKDSMPHNIFN